VAHYKFLVFSDPFEGRDDEYNEWYTNSHLSQLLALRGIIAVQRFKMVEGDDLPKADHRYMAIYEIETDDLNGFYAALRAASASGQITTSPAYNRAASQRAFYVPITERRIP
jgi:hypothetical protein